MSSATSITVPLLIERPRRPWQHAPGLVIVAALVAAGFALNQQIPSASPLLWAMGLGILAAPLVHGRASTTAGIRLSATHLLRVGVALLGLSISLGELASVVDDSVQLYVDIISRGTPAEGAALDFQHRPATMLCGDCSRAFEVRATLPSAFPHCGGSRLRITGGRGLSVESIDVSDDRAHPGP